MLNLSREKVVNLKQKLFLKFVRAILESNTPKLKFDEKVKNILNLKKYDFFFVFLVIFVKKKTDFQLAYFTMIVEYVYFCSDHFITPRRKKRH